MKIFTFTTKIYRCRLEDCGEIICEFLESRKTTVSDTSIGVREVNSFYRAYVRNYLPRGSYLVQTTCKNGRYLFSVRIDL